MITIVTRYHYKAVVSCRQHPDYSDYINPIIISGNKETYEECISELTERLNGMAPIKTNIWYDPYKNVFDGIKYPERG